MRLVQSIPRKIVQQFKQKTAMIRKQPDFLIIGAQRCGTTSLFKYLCDHPNIVLPFKKELHFYDRHFERGGHWYRQFFPTTISLSYLNKVRKVKMLCGEATPMYLFHPLVPYRVSMMLPDIKLIVILRNPIERAYSHYWHEVRAGNEWLSFEDAIEREGSRLQGERHKIILNNGRYSGAAYSQHSYLARGIYVDQLKVWFKLFPKNQVLIIKSEDFFTKTVSTLDSVYDFLGLPTGDCHTPKIYQKGDYSPMPASDREKLKRYFQPSNERLYAFLDRDFNWERD